ncbi:MAG TPA: GtrA family protein [Paracoccus sp.]|nr:GtrA family protein [Paracoccus sp. (in: a-proteobacteria)]
MSRTALVLRYGVFAALAVLANLAAQRLVLTSGEGPAHFALAVGFGTLAGLVVKYHLDKRWIFYDTASGFAAQGRQFSLYTAMGLVTTAIFWGTETVFWAIWQTHPAREAGAILGLAVGYVVKYHLDRRFVFDAARGI